MRSGRSRGGLNYLINVSDPVYFSDVCLCSVRDVFLVFFSSKMLPAQRLYNVSQGVHSHVSVKIMAVAALSVLERLFALVTLNICPLVCSL